MSKGKPKAGAIEKKSTGAVKVDKAQAASAVLKKSTKVVRPGKQVRKLLNAKRTGMFADLPAAPTPTQKGTTADKFVIGARQNYTTAGHAIMTGASVNARENHIVFPEEGHIMIGVNAGWAAGRDVAVECWGAFGSDAMRLDMFVEGPGRVGSVEVPPPASKVGRLRFAIPSADFEVGKKFVLRLQRDDRKNAEYWVLHTCTVSRS